MAEISRKFINMYLIFPKNLILKYNRNWPIGLILIKFEKFKKK